MRQSGEHGTQADARDLRAQLQQSLGGAYTLGRELGGGGMSRVFLADEPRLGRRVVVKVLAPELAAGLSVERFEREIRLAGSLQQANIVPVLVAGEVGGLPYYTMPYVDGESLRARLAAGPLSILDAVGILRDVARALAHAHRQGIVHRDIKPDNVLLSEGAAVVTDFGIAKALAAAKTGDSRAMVTQTGMSLGTPAYMAPEQAAGDLSADHRADLYAFGCMAYELLAGRPPFHGLSPHRVLAAHLTDRPRDVRELRPDVPPALAELVMRCLEKEVADRPQSASEVLQALEAATSGGSHAPGPAIALATRRALGRALAVYAVAFLLVALLAYVAIGAVGLPEWVFPGALIVMALGLPVILITGLVHHQARAARTVPTLTPGGTPAPRSTLATLAVKARPHMTWRRATLGGVAAVGLFALLVAGYMTLRAMGVGPAGSLLARGTIEERGRLLVTDFRAIGPDSTLGSAVAEAVRSHLAQSSVVSVLPPTAVGAALERMQRPRTSRVDLPLAREIAAREGVKAVVDGDVRPLGAGFLVTLRLVAAPDGAELASFTRAADAPGELIPTVDRLARDLRGKIGESLRTVHAAPPLAQVTTPSLEALRAYAQGLRAIQAEGNFPKGRALLEEAIALDSGFAMAYRKLAMEASNRGQPALSSELLEKAYAHRDRLTEVERLLTTGSYWWQGPQRDEAKALTAYERALALSPNDLTALNNAAIIYEEQRNFARGAELYARELVLDTTERIAYTNLANALVSAGRMPEAKATLARARRVLPDPSDVAFHQAQLLASTFALDSAELLAHQLVDWPTPDPIARERGLAMLTDIARSRGRLAESLRLGSQRSELAARRGLRAAPLHRALDEANIAIWYLGDSARGARLLDAALARHPLDSIPTRERPFLRLVVHNAYAGRVAQAKTALAAFERSLPSTPSPGQRSPLLGARATIALAERRYDDAIRDYAAADIGPCTICALPGLASAYDLAGSADSAIAVFTRYIERPEPFRLGSDGIWRAGVYKRLGELYDAKGDHANAATYYAKFVELWKDADPELQPKVRGARERLAQLQQQAERR